MSEEIKENIKAYYIGSDIDKVLDYIQQKENIIKESIKLTSKVNEMESARDLYDLVVDIKNKLKDSDKNE